MLLFCTPKRSKVQIHFHVVVLSVYLPFKCVQTVHNVTNKLLLKKHKS